jgi:hypothetical protein
VNNTRVNQTLADTVRTPPADVPTLAPAEEPPAPAPRLRGAKEVPVLEPAEASRKAQPSRPPLPETPPPVPQAKKVPSPPPAKEDDEDDALWKSIDLEMEPKQDPPDVNLEEAKDDK